MRKQPLKPNHKVFADTYIDTGNATLAAKEAMSVTNDNSAGAVGSRLLRNAKIIEYIEGKAEHVASIVYEIAQFGESDPVRLSASKDILDRAGFKPVERTQNVNLNLDADLTTREQELGQTLRELLA